MSHSHSIKKTHITLTEYDDVKFNKLAADLKYYGEGNSRNRQLEYTFEYCLSCNLRLLNGKSIQTQGVLDDFELLVTQAKKGLYKPEQQTTVQHSDFEVLQRLIKAALEFGKLKEKQ